ncbi:MAG: ACS family MFS transporter [Gemmatimonadales bacterium]|nr:ACS family MFS transporter [Gemmatimonadota bacterium]MCC7134575.1 ACS family MFS transporter [Gemmatimonadales bacterium]MDX2056395.1 ACS family MFS transporter [Gemmatimonadales bacterium]
MTATPEARPAGRWPAWYLVVGLCFAAVFISYLDRTNISVAAIAMQEEFQWTETTKGLVLSSFFIGYIVLQVASGTLANRYGGKLVLGLAVLWWSLFTVLTPPAAELSLAALIVARIALGLGEAAVFPASINMIGRWVPAERRSRAVAMLGSGLSLGTLVALPVTGWLVRSQGWPSPFYIFGALGLVWAIPWFFGVGSGRGVEAEAAPGSRTIPWGRILSTPAVWAIIINHFCNNWSLYVLLAWLPSYFKTTFGVTIASAGILSAAPWAVSFVMANVAGGWADRMIRGGRHPTTVRKTMQLIGLLGGAAGLLLLQQVGSVTMGLVVMCFASGALAFCLAGFGPNAFDVAPKYADVVWGISNTAATIPGIIGVAVTGWLVDRTGGYTAPFVVTAGIAVFGAVVYALFGSGERKID